MPVWKFAALKSGGRAAVSADAEAAPVEVQLLPVVKLFSLKRQDKVL